MSLSVVVTSLINVKKNGVDYSTSLWFEMFSWLIQFKFLSMLTLVKLLLSELFYFPKNGAFFVESNDEK